MEAGIGRWIWVDCGEGSEGGGENGEERDDRMTAEGE